MGVPILVDKLQEGWIVSENVYSGNRILIKEDVVLTSKIIERLKQELSKDGNKAHFVEVTLPEKATEEEKEQLELLSRKHEPFRKKTFEVDYDIPSYISKDLEIDTINSLKKAYVESEKNLASTLNVVSNCVKNITDYIEKNPDFSYSLGRYKDSLTEAEVFEHALRVSEFSVVLANIYNQSHENSNKKINLDAIGTAALLHDYGIRFSNENEMKKLSVYQLGNSFLEYYPTIEPDLLQKPYDEKYRTVYAYVSLKNHLDSSVLKMILLSSESELGNINLHLKNNKTEPTDIAAKIIFLCNVYDSLLYRAIKDNNSLEEVIDQMKQMDSVGSINHEIFDLFINNIPLYSVGVRVLLSNGKYATVIERFRGKDYMTKPILKTLVEPPEKPDLIDLRTTTNVTIVEVVGSSEKLSDKIRQITDDQLKTMNIVSLPVNEYIIDIDTGYDYEKPKAM